jgi:hypothetical protein
MATRRRPRPLHRGPSQGGTTGVIRTRPRGRCLAVVVKLRQWPGGMEAPDGRLNFVSVSLAHQRLVTNIDIGGRPKMRPKQSDTSSVLIWRSHELWRESAEERANRHLTVEASQELWPKRLRLLGFLRPATAAETVRIGHNGGEEGIRTLDTGLPRITV